MTRESKISYLNKWFEDGLTGVRNDERKNALIWKFNDYLEHLGEDGLKEAYSNIYRVPEEVELALESTERVV